jgi:hypothetical protein
MWQRNWNSRDAASFSYSTVMSPMAMPLSRSESDRNVILHTQLDSSVLNYKSSEALWPHRLDVVIIKVRAHIMIVVALHAVLKFGLTDAG